MSGDYTHCLLVIAESDGQLKTYLHHQYHLTDWMAAVKPYGKGIVVFDSELAIELSAGKLLHISMVKLRAPVCVDPLVDILNDLPGIKASFRPHLGAEFLESVDWPDKAAGFTHIITLVADDVAALRTYV